MTTSDLRLVSALLRLAAEEFSNHGCNDFDLGKFLTETEQRDLSRRFHEWNGDLASHEEDVQNGRSFRYSIGDSSLMAYFASVIGK